MDIKNQEDLLLTVETISELLQSIQDYCQNNHHPEAKVRFPRGYLRNCNEIRKDYQFIKERHVQDNIAYTTLLSEIISWLINRTHIVGIARAMLIKIYIVFQGAIIESITKNLKGRCGQSFDKRTDYLFNQEIIDEKLKNELCWIWGLRSNIHLYDLQSREYDSTDYTRTSIVRCNSALKKLMYYLQKDSHN